MTKPVLQRGIYLITEHEQLDFMHLMSLAKVLLPAGIAAFQYRNKIASPAQRKDEALQLHELCKQHNVPFIINDDVTLALDIGADGVHLGQDDGDCMAARARTGTNKLIGISCYNDPARAETAVQQGANYIAFGAMFPTRTKVNAKAASVELIREAKRRYTVPVVAIGGITPENCAPIIEAGADLLAVISSVWLVPDPLRVIIKFNQLMGTSRV